MSGLAIALFAIGILIVAANAYVMLLRYPLLRLLGKPASEIKFVSVVPVVGSIALLGAASTTTNSSLIRVAWIAALLDCGGIHVAACALVIWAVMHHRS